VLACCQKTDAKAANHGCLENLAHFELRFVKNLGTSSRYAFFMQTVCLCLTLPCRQKQATNAQPQTNPIHSPSKQQII